MLPLGAALVALGCGRTPVVIWDEERAPADSAPHAEQPPDGWLVTVDTNGYELLRIDAADGTTEILCALEPDGARYTSSAFGPGGRLFVTYKVDASDTAPDRLAVLDPCTCEKEVLAEYGFGGAAGLAWSGEMLYALSHSADELLELDPGSGASAVIGPAGFDIRNHGASWSEAEGAIVVLEGSEDRLYRVDPATGRAEILARLRFDFGTVGFEVHPRTGRLYACTGDAVLYQIDATSGSVSAVGSLDHPGNCGNLAAAGGAVACVGA